ncbi:MAG TPA: type II toxin-antitoxin system VapC family toxin [Geminicoccaceae bacterium]|nr:type II toxin-antitoxin system VapC family toxin [Geminicoccaceae bacterium]
MSAFVLDCSITLAWCFEDEATPQTDALLERLRDEGALVPGLWHLEVGNALLQAERRGRIATARVAAFVELLTGLPIETDAESASRALREVLGLARAEKLTTYDSSYLELAGRRALPLATRDQALHRAAQRIGVPLLP